LAQSFYNKDVLPILGALLSAHLTNFTGRSSVGEVQLVQAEIPHALQVSGPFPRMAWESASSLTQTPVSYDRISRIKSCLSISCARPTRRPLTHSRWACIEGTMAWVKATGAISPPGLQIGLFIRALQLINYHSMVCLLSNASTDFELLSQVHIY